MIFFSLQPQQQATILPYNPACIQARRDSIDVEAIMHRTNLTLHPPPEVMASVRPLPPPPEVMAAVRPMQPPPPVSLPQVPESPRRGWVPTQATHHNPTPSNAALLLGKKFCSQILSKNSKRGLPFPSLWGRICSKIAYSFELFSKKKVIF